MILSQIKERAPQYRSLPFWSWNEELNPVRLQEQMEQMADAGIGGFFMHSRGGLITEYMGDEWMECIQACVEKSHELNMEAWAYDENGWPSGFADGGVPTCGVEFQQKYLLLSTVGQDGVAPKNTLICFRVEGGKAVIHDVPVAGDHCIVYEVNPHYIDALNSEAIAVFLKKTHQVYRDKLPGGFDGGLKGFFTDEPQYGNGGKPPWSHLLADMFHEEYGYDLVAALPGLFFDTDMSDMVRYDYYTLINRMLAEGFIKQMYDWCEQNGTKMTGHMMGEDLFLTQLWSTAGVMACYPYFHIPGIDWLGRKIDSPVIPKQLGSAAAQFGKTQTLTESFGLCGWDVSFNELKWIAGWQFVNGVNRVCQHLESYSLKGSRKRDYPPSLFVHQPWWGVYSYLNEYLAKTGAAISMGTEQVDTLILHPLRSAYLTYTPVSFDAIYAFEKSFVALSSRFSGQHVPYHYGDDSLIRSHGRIDGGAFVVGQCWYKVVILPDMITIADTTLSLLLEFLAAGGTVYSAGKLPRTVNGREINDGRLAELGERVKPLTDDYYLSMPIQIDGEGCEDVHFQIRELEDGSRLCFMANLGGEERCLRFSVKGEYGISLIDVMDETDAPIASDIVDGRTVAEITFTGYQHRLISIANTRAAVAAVKPPEVRNVPLGSRFEIREQTLNTYTMDICEYRIDGGKWQAKKEVLFIQEELVSLRRACDVDLRFCFNVADEAAIDELYLLAEEPDQAHITINGHSLDGSAEGYYIDHAFRKIDVSKYIQCRENTIIYTQRFELSEHTYHTILDPVHEAERNKLTVEVELESCYLAGRFAVRHDGDVQHGERNTIFTKGEFVLESPAHVADISNITESGYWFFAGQMRLAQTVKVVKADGVRYQIALSELCAPAAKVFINGSEAGVFVFAPYELDVTDLIRDGDNEVEIIMYSTCRNMLGAHHYDGGESYKACPDVFLNRYIANEDAGFPVRDSDYCFVRFGAGI